MCLRDVAPQPWRKGGSSTRELLTWPEAQGWRLRVSVAAITQDGDFSAFPGVDRWFAVLHGEGVALALPAGGVEVRGDSDAVHFAGESAPSCRLLGGATQDLNLMVLRGSGRATLRRAHAGSALQGSSLWRGLYAAQDLTIECDGLPLHLGADTLLWSDALAPSEWRLQPRSQPLQAWWLNLEAA